MAVKGFPSPAHALARIVDCLGELCPGMEVHTGSTGSGETIECCSAPCVLRVEEVSTSPAGGEAAMSTKCMQLRTEVDVIYSQCFMSNTKSGKARSAEKLSIDGMELVASGWEALAAIKCCAPWNQWIRFVSLTDDPPMGNCAGWTMRLSVDVTFCDPCNTGS